MRNIDNYKECRDWSDKRMEVVRSIIGKYLTCAGTVVQDVHQMGDLIILRAGTDTIGVRLREGHYKDSFHYQFTFRSWRKSGIKTELHKILEGWGDYFFYGFSPEHHSDSLSPWYLLDLGAFRYHWGESRPFIRYGEQKNRDGSSGFHWFSIPSFPKNPPLVVHASEPIPYQTFASSYRQKLTEKSRQIEIPFL